MLLLGQVPAWFHVATCHGEPHALRVAEPAPAVEESACSHCCHHHSDEAESDEEGTEESSEGHHGHDSGTCAICQSLAAPSGVAVELDQTVVTLPVEPALLVVRRTDAPAAILTSAHPRGPPAGSHSVA